MYSRQIWPPKDKSFFLFGPRGTGKTTWVRSAFPKAVYVDLLEAEVFNDLLANPQRLDKFVPPEFKDWVVIDEVQRVPELLNEVHRLIENRRLRFVLTGSSPRKIKKTGPNLLAGRALTLHVYPLTAAELGKDFDLKHSLLYGELPCAYTEQNPKAYLESYVKTYLEEEVRQEGLTRSLSAFSRFLEAASFSQGGLLNISEVARECAVERKVVQNYFSILEDLLIGYRLPLFTKRAKRRVISHPKFYFFDAGVYRTIRPMGPLDAPEESRGVSFETLLLQEIFAVNSYFRKGYDVYYWRTLDGREVDFVLYGPRGIRAFEAKSGGRVSSEMLKGLKAFHREYPQAKLYFIYGGERSFWEGDIQIIPARECFKKLSQLL